MREAKDAAELEISWAHVSHKVKQRKDDQIWKALSESEMRKGEYEENRDKAIGYFVKEPIKE